MKLGRPIKITDGIYQIRAVGARVTAVITDEGTLLVDVGAKGSLRLIAGGFEALDINLEAVQTIALTHYHPDHSGGLDELVEATSAKVAVHVLEAAIVSGREPPPSPHQNRIIARIARPFVAPMYGDPVNVDYPLEDGEQLAVLEPVKVIHTPGHTAGSICLYVPAQRVVIVGDALQHRFRRLGPPAESVTVDSKQARRSLEKLLSLDFDTVCFGHFPPLREGAKDALRQLVQRVGS